MSYMRGRIGAMEEAASKRRWRVYCSQWTLCGWAGYRRAVTREEAKEKPCPKCGRGVAA